MHSKAKMPGLISQLAAFFFFTLASARTQIVTVGINASVTGPPISKYLYGQFLEHIGGIVNNGIWAEMLDDRKVYNPITMHPPAEQTGPSFRRSALRPCV